jgi:peptide/nickel transport system ATP-binding protein
VNDPIVVVEHLTALAGDRRLVSDVSFTVHPGRVLALVGESGSGKTTTGLALLGERGPGVRLEGQVRVAGRAGYVPQDPVSVLNPARRVGAVLAEVVRRHSPRQAAVSEIVRDVVERARLSEVDGLLRRYPHQLSGGQQQRLVLAQMLACRPSVVVVDEPTTGQDPITRAEVVEEFRSLAGQGLGIVLLSHDLDVVRELADDIVVMLAGRVVESGPAARVLEAPRHEYTRGLVAAAAPGTAGPARETGAALLSVRGLAAGVLSGISLDVDAGECLAVVGRSGSGKTTLGRCVAGLRAPAAGSVLLRGQALAGRLQRRPRSQRALVQYVFQDARGSFAPHWPVVEQIGRTAVRLHGMDTDGARRAAVEIAGRMGLSEQTIERLPGKLSGGELQRAALARALLARPDVLICDEITSGLDPVTQKGILDLLDDLRSTAAVALIVISHDAGVVARLADRVLPLES